MTNEVLIDIDGNQYKTVKIGNQIWMAENYKTTRYRDGRQINYSKDYNDWKKFVIERNGAFCYVEYNTEYKDKYGALYNAIAIRHPSFAPRGWHVPTSAEWNELIKYCGTDEKSSSESLKATSGWEIHRELSFYKRITNILKGVPSEEKYNGNNKSGFNALANNHFSYACEASWWCIDYSDVLNNISFNLFSSEDFDQCSMAYWVDDDENYGYINPLEPDSSDLLNLSVRLIKDI